MPRHRRPHARQQSAAGLELRWRQRQRETMEFEHCPPDRQHAHTENECQQGTDRRENVGGCNSALEADDAERALDPRPNAAARETLDVQDVGFPDQAKCGRRDQQPTVVDEPKDRKIAGGEPYDRTRRRLVETRCLSGLARCDRACF